MSEESESSLNKETSSASSLNSLIKVLSSKTEQIKLIISKNKIDASFNTYFDQMIKCIEDISTTISSNLDYLADTSLFSNDFQQSVNTISIAVDSYVKSIESIPNPSKNPDTVNIVKNDIINFAESLNIFTSNFLEIMSNKSTSNQTELQSTIINTRLALESTLFNLSVKFQRK